MRVVGGPWRRVARCALAATWVLLLACTPTPRETPLVDALPDHCGDGCPSPLVCDFGVCAARPNAARMLTLRLVPPSSRDVFGVRWLADVPVTPGMTLPDLRLSEAPVLDAEVALTVDGAASNRSAAAVLTFRPQLAGGRPIGTLAARSRGDGSVVPEGTGPLDDAAPFRLPPGVYDVRVAPTESDVPPARFAGVAIGIDDTAITWSLAVPDTDQLRVDGQVLGTANGEAFGVEGLAVRARSVDATQESTTGTTAADGTFVLVLPDEAPGWIFEVGSLGRTEVQLDAQFAAFDLRGIDERVELLLGEQPLPVDVALDARGGDGLPIEAGIVLADTVMPPRVGNARGPGVASGHWRISTTLSGDTTTIPVVPGEARVTVGALDARNGITTSPALSIGATPGQRVAVDVARRSEVAIEVLDPFGRPVPHAQVLARPEQLTTRLDAGLSRGLFGAFGATDELGEVTLAVQPGIYRLFITPTRDRDGVASATFSETLALDGASALQVVLPFAGVVSGRIRDAQGDGIGGVTVEAFDNAIIADDAPPVAQGITDQSGRFRLLIPFDAFERTAVDP